MPIKICPRHDRLVLKKAWRYSVRQCTKLGTFDAPKHLTLGFWQPDDGLCDGILGWSHNDVYGQTPFIEAVGLLNLKRCLLK